MIKPIQCHDYLVVNTSKYDYTQHFRFLNKNIYWQARNKLIIQQCWKVDCLSIFGSDPRACHWRSTSWFMIHFPRDGGRKPTLSMHPTVLNTIFLFIGSIYHTMSLISGQWIILMSYPRCGIWCFSTSIQKIIFIS